MDPDVFATTLTTSRPRPVPPEHRNRILGSLSPDGVMSQLPGRLQNKLTALGPLLRAADRDAVYDVRVVDVPLARIGLYERTVLLISGTALELLPAEDLRAQVAHELGHEYVATEHDRATQAGDRRRLSELELMCDAVGMVMLQKLGMDPSRLMRSIEKLTLYNRQVFQTAMDESGYPTLDERRKFADAVRRWLAKRKAGGSHALDGSMEPGRLRIPEPVCDALQQPVHALSLLVFSFFSHMKGGELHPARNPWIGAGIDKKCGDSQRALVGDLAKRCVADACLLVRVHIGAGFQKHPHDVDVSALGGIVQRRLRDLVERIRRSAVGEQLSYAGHVSVLSGKMQVRLVELIPQLVGQFIVGHENEGTPRGDGPATNRGLAQEAEE
jgi:hypothetical protein